MSKKLRHYEIVFLVHPNKSGQIANIVQNYQKLIKDDGGVIHRLEDWGVRSLAYKINKLNKAHYILMNIECSQKVLSELNHNFRFNANIIRSLILNRQKAITSPSPMILQAKLNKTSEEKISPKTEKMASKELIEPEQSEETKAVKEMEEQV